MGRRLGLFHGVDGLFSALLLLGYFWCAQGTLVWYMGFDDGTFAVDTALCPAPQALASATATPGANTAIASTNKATNLGDYLAVTFPGATNPITYHVDPDIGTALFGGNFAQISFAAWFNLDLTGVSTSSARDFVIFAGGSNEPKVVLSLRQFGAAIVIVPTFFLSDTTPAVYNKPLFSPGSFCPDLPPFDSAVFACPNVTTNVWHHLAFTYDGAGLHMFFDGQEQGLPVAFPTPTYNPWSSSDLTVGGAGTSGNQYFGLLDDLRIYDHALQLSEVQALYNAPRPLSRPTISTVTQQASPVVLEELSQLLDITVLGSDPNNAALQYIWEDISTSGCQLLSFLAPNAPSPGITLTGVGNIVVAAGASNSDLCASSYYNYSIIGSQAILQVQPVNGSVYLYEYTDTSVVVKGFPVPSFQWEVRVVRSVVRANDSSIITQTLFLPIPGQISSTLRLLNTNDSFAGLPSRRANTPVLVRVAFQNKYSSGVNYSNVVEITPLDFTRPANSSSGDGDGGTVAAIVVPVVVGPILLCLCCLLLLLLLLAIVAIRRRRGGGEWKPDLTEPDYDALAYGRFLETPPSVSKKQLAALKKLEELLLDSDYLLTRLLCDNAKATEADNVAKVITYLYAAHGEAVGLVQYFITKEVEASNKEGTLFRANSISSKMFTTYSRVIALEYVWTIFAYPVAELDHMAEVASGGSGENSQSHNTIMGPMAMEVDPSKMDEAADDQINTLELWLVAQKLFTGMTKAKSAVPSEVRLLLRHVQTEVAGKFSDEAAHKAMGGFLFLRLLCPSLMAPQVYGLLKAPPNTMAQRQLILLAKVLQNLANDTLPGKKEGYMQRLNEFITSNQERLRSFYADLIAHAEDGPHRRPSVPDNVKTNSLIQLHRYISVNFDKLSAVVQQEDEGLAEELQEVMDSIGNIETDEL